MLKTTFPLHPAQRDIYVDQLINPESPHYNIGGYIKLKGTLDKDKFHEAVNSAAKVFDAFKMRFDIEDTDFKFTADEGYDTLELSELDFSDRSKPVEEAESWMQSRYNIYFPLKRDSLLFEHTLIKISDDEHWLYGRYHHLITDGYGFIVFIQYVGQKYKSLSGSDKDETEFKYPSYLKEVVTASNYFESSAFESDRNYWNEKITAKPDTILQRKYLKQKDSDDGSSSFITEFNIEERASLEEIQLTTKAGLQQLTIAALLIYFGKTSNQSEFIFGIPVHKRGSKVLRSIVGMFSGILPFKGAFQKDKILSELLQEITNTQKNDYRHQNYPLGEINRNLKGRTSEEYLYEISINYEPLNFELDFGKDIEANVFRLESDHERNPLQLFWRDYGKQQPLKLIVNFSNEYFNIEEIELFVKRILFIFKQFPEALEKNSGSINILPPEESLLLEKFNDISEDFTKAKSIVKLFEKQAAKFPDSVALIFEDQQLSYKELNERSNQIAHYLRDKGVKEETLVPIFIERSPEMIIGIMAILKAGGAYVPMDPAYPAERIKFMLEDTGAAIIVSSKNISQKLHTSKNVEHILLDQIQPILDKQQKTNPKTKLSSNNLAYIIYTSGSTGKPKGVMIEHGTVVNLINSQSKYFNVKSDERILQFSNYSFDASVEQIFLALLNGASLVLFREGLQLDLERFENFIKEKKINHLHATPSFIDNLNSNGYENLKRVIAGGDVCKKELAEKWNNKVKFYNEYGPTETTVTAIEYLNENNTEKNISLPIGKPLGNIKVYILNKENELCPVGVSGEICIAGDCLARGYLNRAELTEEKFVKNPFDENTGSRMYMTGDTGRWLTDGNIEYLGRTDEQVKIRGYRIEPGEIESALLEFEMISKAVVIAKPDNNGNNRLIGYVVPNGKLDKEAVQIFLKEKLPEYMIPSLWVELESLPITSNGKIDRKVLPDAGELISTVYVAPDSEMEIKLSELWKEILKIDKAGINDNFFELGGHSLNAIQLTSALYKNLNIKTDIGTIFANPTIKKLSGVLKSHATDRFIEIKKLAEKNHYELSHAQKRFWILSNFKDGSEAYNISNVFIIEGSLDVNAFKKAFDKVIERHEILRTVFEDVNGEPLQRILTLNEIAFKIEEFDIQNKADADAIVKKYLEDDTKRAFDLKTGPLIRAALFTEEGNKFIFVFNIHHIISDGWSKGIFVKEFLDSYKSLINVEDNNLTPLRIQYKDYAAWHSESFEKQGKYWKELYEKDIPVLNFPLDFERPKVLSYFGEMIHKTVPESLTLSLQKTAVKNNMSLNNLLMSLYGMLVAGKSGQEEVVIGSVSSGRSHPDLENLIGVFINFLPVKLSPKKYLKLSEYLGNSLSTISQSYNNQDYPFDLMVEDCIKKRDISRNPFFDTMINFQLENDFEKEVNSESDKTGITIKPYQSIQEDLFQSVLDFKLDVEPAEGKLNLYLSYNSKLFSKQTMSSFLDEFTELLNNAVKNPDGYMTEYVNWEKESPAEVKAEAEKLPVNLCASFVLEPVQEYMEYWSNEIDLSIKINFAPYNQMFQQLLNPGSLLYGSKGINILFFRLEDWIRNQKDLSKSGQIKFLDQNYAELIAVLGDIRKKTFIPFLGGILPVYTNSFDDEVKNHINKLNTDLELFLNDHPSFQILDLNDIAELYEIEEIYDASSDEMGHMPFTPEYYAALGTYLTRKVSAFKNPGYKVIALDCDNTLWKGICGEAGALNVIIDENFTELQEFFIKKYNEGFLLVLCSKNNEADVWEVFDKHPGMKLKREHIAAHRINWDPKPANLLSISSELNLGINSVIFVDDNEFETEQMTLSMPDVLSLTLPEETESFLGFLNHIWAFDYFRITDEDRRRNDMYKVEKQRKEEEVKFGTLSDFLKSLDIKVDIRPIAPKDIERAVQLSLRTNQFNLNGVRKTPEEIATSINNNDSINWIIEVKDRFGDYGIVGVVLAKLSQNTLILETFLLSCRVLGRNVEGIILSELEKYCVKHELDTITALYQPTLKNKPFQEFLSNYDWISDSQLNAYNYFLKTPEQIITQF